MTRKCLCVVGSNKSGHRLYCLAPAKKSHIGPRCAGHFPAVVK